MRLINSEDKSLYLKIKALRDHGQIQKNDHKFIGYNYRMEELQGAVLTIKLRKLNTWILKRRQIAKLYNKFLKGIVIVPPESSLNYSNFQYYAIRCKNRDKLKEYLGKKGISTLIHYPKPIHLQEAYKFLGLKSGDFPVTERVSKEILSLPMYPELTKKQVYYISNLVKKFYLK